MRSNLFDKLTVQEAGGDTRLEGGFLARDVIRFIVVDIILIYAVRIIGWVGLIRNDNQHVLYILAGKVILFGYLYWLVSSKRSALPETGITTPGPWWAWPLGLVCYAGCYPLLIFINRANTFFLEHLYGWCGMVYEPQAQKVLLYLFADVLDLPVLLLLVFFTVFAGPFMEELAFRGVGLDAYRRRSGTALAVLVTSVLFGLFHFDVENLLPLSCLGAVFAAVRLFSKSLWCAAFIHSVHNAVVLLVLAHQLGFLPQIVASLRDLLLG